MLNVLPLNTHLMLTIKHDIYEKILNTYVRYFLIKRDNLALR